MERPRFIIFLSGPLDLLEVRDSKRGVVCWEKSGGLKSMGEYTQMCDKDKKEWW